MFAIICAGGLASRMGKYSSNSPKSLFELEPGITILDHVLERIESAKPQKIVLVTRPEFRDSFERRVGDRVEIIEADLDEFENLYSVYLALNRVGNPFLIAMSDHIFESSMLMDLISHKSDRAFTVCLDRNPSRSEAMEGLKLHLIDEKVIKAGKDITPRYGIDTGLILCREKARGYIEEAIRAKGPEASISDALNLAASDGEVDYVDVTGRLWKDIDTPEDLVKARRIYWEILRRELIKKDDGIISRYLNRPISTRISLAIYKRRMRVNPMLISAISFILCLISAISLSNGMLILGGLLAQLASILDGVDGEVARLFRRASGWGGFIDAILDRIADVALISGLTLSLGILDRSILILAIMASANSILVSYVAHGLKSLNVNLRKLRMIPVARDARIFVIFLSCIFSVPIAALLYISTLPIPYSLASIYIAYKSGSGAEEKTLEKGKPFPEVLEEQSEVIKLIREFLLNSFKMGFALLLVRLISPSVSDLTISMQDLSIEGGFLLTLLDFLIIIYFGYKMLNPLKGIMDLISELIVERVGITKTVFWRMITDLFYTILLAVLWTYLPSLSRPFLGDWAYRILSIAVIIFLIIFIYDLIKLIYMTFEDVYVKIIDKIAGRLSG
jgi:choline kinase/phosphatidylglycerophosphate synthase